MKFFKIAFVLAGLSFAAAAPASAATTETFDWSATGPFSVTGSGVLTATLENSATNEWLITAFSGTVGGNTITALLAPGAYEFNDNLLFPTDPSVLSTNGVSFVANGHDFEFFALNQPTTAVNPADSNYGLITNSPGLNGTSGTFTVTAAVPEPSTWAMLMLGFAAIGFLGYRQNRKATFA